MTRDELEFSISQYLDGTLAERERDALDERFATDAEARALLAEYRSLEGILSAAPLPEIRWDQFAAQISAASREQAPAQSYSISRWFRPSRLAIAASVLVAGGLAFSALRPAAVDTPPPSLQPIQIVVVDAPSASTVNVAVGPSSDSVQVAIGPSTDKQGKPTVLRYADSVVQRPSKALIVSAAPAGQDTLLTPF